MNKANEFLSDTYVFDKELYESTLPEGNNGSILRTIKGPIAEWDSLNRNKRKYSEKLWDKALSSDYVQEQLKYHTLYGEANHPVDRYEVDFERVSHSITEMWKEPGTNKVYATINILNTPFGRILNTLYDAGGVLGYSTRAGGTLIQKKGYVDVDENTYNFVTVDAVPFPSVKSARPEISEGVEIEEIVELDEEFHNQICKIINEAPEASKEALKELIYSIKGYNFEREIALLEGNNPDDNAGKDEPDGMTTLSLLKESSLKIDKLEADKVQLKTTNSSLQDKVSSLTENLNSSLQTIQELTNENASLKKNAEDSFKVRDDTIKEYKKIVEQLEDEISDVTYERDSLKGVETAFKAIKEESKGLAVKYSEDVKSIKESKEAEVLEAKQRCDILEQQLSESCSEISKMILEANELNGKLDEAREQINALQGNNSQLVSESSSLQGNVDELKDRNSDLVNENSSLSKANKSLEERLDEAYTELISVISSNYGVNVDTVRNQLPRKFNKSDIYKICEELSNNITTPIIEGVVKDVDEAKPVSNEPNKSKIINEGLFLNRRGLNLK